MKNEEYKVERVQWKNGKPWEPGPWDNEPDRIEWRHCGFACLIVRNDSGALCGYVGVPLDHPAITAPGDTFEVHGGLTFGGPCRPGSPICHTPQPGESEVYWLGFDCAHCFDLSPHNGKHGTFPAEEIYRDVAYVRAEVISLADQIAKLRGVFR